MKRKTEKFQINLVRRLFSNLFPLHSVVDLFSFNLEPYLASDLNFFPDQILKIKKFKQNYNFLSPKTLFRPLLCTSRLQEKASNPPESPCSSKHKSFSDLLLVWDSVADPGCLYRIPDPKFSIPDPKFSIPDPGLKIYRIHRIKEFKYF